MTVQAPPPSPLTRPTATLVVLLGSTVIGTISNNSLNVVVRSITEDFHARVSLGVLVVSSFVLVLSSAMAVTGWVGDRFGRSRVLACALSLMLVGQVAAALVPNLGLLVAVRAVQGLACAAIPPAVMGLLSTCYPTRRAWAMSTWAAANGVGQAIGAPFGGLVAGTWGWRAIFWLSVPFTAAAVLGTRVLPADVGRKVALHCSGAVALTGGALLTMSGLTVLSQQGFPVWLGASLTGCGAAGLVVFAVVSRRSPNPLVAPADLAERRFLRSAVAAFVQMFALAVVLVGVPLYLTGALDRSIGIAGIVVFVLPVSMTLLAPAAGRLCERGRPRQVLRAGLVVLLAGCAALGGYLGVGGSSLVALGVLLALVGAGVALVQTPSAAGATRSRAGRSGAALGLFNMVRFAGSALGASWVAVAYGWNPGVDYIGAGGLVLVALLMVGLGDDRRVDPDQDRLGTVL